MILVRKLGILLTIAGFVMLIAALFGSHYKLTPEVLRGSINNDDHLKRIELVTQGIIGRDYSSIFSFVHDFRRLAEGYNEQARADKRWNDIIYTDYTFIITKNSTFGWVRDYCLLLLIMITFLFTAGGLCYAFGKYIPEKPGIRNNHVFFDKLNARGWIGILLGTFLIALYIVLYFAPEYIVNWVIITDPLSTALNKHGATQWFMYGTIYTIAVLVMGVRMLLKYRHNRYQQIRTFSVMFFQMSFAFIIPEILVSLNKPWYDFKNIWPLNYTFFYDYNLNAMISSGMLGWFMLFWGILLIIIAVPVFTYFFGKRWYCSWVCGCGGLAETAGDPFRHLSDKSLRAWKIERWLVHGVLVFAVVMTAVTLTNYFSDYKLLGDATGKLHKAYGFFIGAIFSGVVGTGFYPLMGNRMWCRFGCPLAAYLGLVQRFKSRFRITTNGGQCISCGNCSTYCEMGIDVRWYAQRGQNIVRSSCVGCGICAAVCPRGVLRLENGKEEGRFGLIAGR